MHADQNWLNNKCGCTILRWLFSESAISFSNLQISKKKLFQITILNLKFEIPAHNSKQLIQISSSG